jgi:RNA-directed DNA polymerase
LRTLGPVPGRELLKQWLKAGYVEEGVFHETPCGTPQGGVISPLLLNIALHGLEAALGVQRNCQGRIVGKRAVVRYADDFVVFCESREDAQLVVERILPEWLAKRGLGLSPDKTRIVHLREGFDFLGFHTRHYEAPQTARSGYKLLIKPSKRSVTELRKKVRALWLQLRGHSIQAVLHRLNPLIRGWANFFRTVVSTKVFEKLDHWMVFRALRYAKRAHPQKPKYWRTRKYWGKLNPKSNDPFVFGDKRTGRYLLKFSWFKIERHVLVRGTASPDDPALRDYWWARRKINIRHLTPSDVKLAEAQDWLCPVCGQNLINGEELQRHHKQPKGLGGSDAYSNRELLHLYCHQQRHRTRDPCCGR